MSYNDGSYLFGKRNHRLRNVLKSESIQDNCKGNVMGNMIPSISKTFEEDCSPNDSAFYHEVSFKKDVHYDHNSQAGLSEIKIKAHVPLCWIALSIFVRAIAY